MQILQDRDSGSMGGELNQESGMMKDEKNPAGRSIGNIVIRKKIFP